jgi:hypothetical protein
MQNVNHLKLWISQRRSCLWMFLFTSITSVNRLITDRLPMTEHIATSLNSSPSWAILECHIGAPCQALQMNVEMQRPTKKEHQRNYDFLKLQNAIFSFFVSFLSNLITFLFLIDSKRFQSAVEVASEFYKSFYLLTYNLASLSGPKAPGPEKPNWRKADEAI